jgi:hypothetical protein
MVFYALRARKTFFLKSNLVLITLLIRLHFSLGCELALSLRIRSHSEAALLISPIVHPEFIANDARTVGGIIMARPRRRSGLYSSYSSTFKTTSDWASQPIVRGAPQLGTESPIITGWSRIVISPNLTLFLGLSFEELRWFVSAWISSESLQSRLLLKNEDVSIVLVLVSSSASKILVALEGVRLILFIESFNILLVLWLICCFVIKCRECSEQMVVLIPVGPSIFMSV